MFCAKCGASATPEARFCPSCGAPLASTSSITEPVKAPSESGTEVIAEKRSEKVQQVSSSIPLHDGESVLWHRATTQGLIHKEVVSEEAVTNQRCIKYDVKNNQVVAQIGIDHRPEVVVMNLHRVNDSLGGGVFLTPRMFGLPGLGGFGVYGGPRRGNIKIFGDASIMDKGNIIMTFQNIQDPQSLRQLVEVLKRQEGFAGPRYPGRMLQMRRRMRAGAGGQQDWND